MKRVGIFLIVILFMLIGNSSFAQVTVIASTTFVAPITIVKNMEVRMEHQRAGNAQIAKRRTTQALSQNTVASITKTSKFNAPGQDNYMYTVTLPVSCKLTGNANDTLTIKGFTSSPVTGNIEPGGLQILQVGATLHIPVGQAPGSYSSASGVPVTVNYN